MTATLSPEAKVYEEVVNLIATGGGPASVTAFRPSEAAKSRVLDLLAREKQAALSPEETAELSHYVQLEHLLRLAKARAHAR